MPRIFYSVFAFLAVAMNPALSFADTSGAAVNHTIWSTWMPEAASPVKERIHTFSNIINTIIGVIVVVVGVLMVYAIVRFSKKRNPIPSKTTHHVKLEVIWTLIPCLILLAIAVPSLRLMYFMDRTVKPDLTLKVTGYQWYWGYSYPEQELEEFSLNIIPNEEFDKKHEYDALRALPTYQRLLSTYDLATGKPAFVVLPAEKNVRVLATSNDVIHSFAMPAFGVKKDAVPGRLNETWFRVKKPGIYYGQCSEICGINHGYMPIEIRAVPQEQFDQWVTLMKTDQPKAMDYIQNLTVQYAHNKLVAPKLTLPLLWEDFKDAVITK